ncbi:adenosine deaminase, putative [Plasmodium gallinaceum]|nr:adenosine deaminase, putative [Plasmodium gallinaceum]CRG97310.1 adenosine deaminase, putative [Plasmodium gallinaceum]
MKMTILHEEINFLKKDELNINLKCLDKKERYKIWRRIPKCELHCHLDLCFSLEFFLKCVRKYNLQPDLTDDEVVDYYLFKDKGKSLNEFIERSRRVTDIFINYDIIKDIAKNAVFNKYKEGVILIEFRYSPSYIAYKYNLCIDLIHKTIVEGINEAVEKLNHKIHVGLICIGETGISEESLRKAAEFCVKNKKDFVGFDHAGHERDLKPYKEIYDYVRENGIPLTIHAGEDLTLPNLNTIYSAIEVLKAKRIGHGIRVIESEDLINLIKKNDILLEICPISNLLLNNVKSMDTHPIKKLYDSGIKVSVNTDDPGMFLTEINDEYEELYLNLNFNLEDFMKMNLWALEKSFVKSEIKDKLKKLYF